MKLIYQQMIAFFVVITALLAILGFSFFHVTKTLIYENTWNQLEGYAYSLKTQSMTIERGANGKQTFTLDIGKLQTSELLLRNQQVHFTIYTTRNKVMYPDQGYQSTISTSDWKKLESGQIIRRKSDLGWRGPDKAKVQNQQRMTDILAPCFDQSGQLVAVTSVGAKVSSLQESFTKIQRNLFYVLLFSALLGVAISYLLAHYITKRISKLRNATRAVANGDFDVTLVDHKRDELDDLANDFNQMTSSLKQSNEEISRQEQKRRQFMADAAHEMRTPLTTINGLLEGLAYDAIPEESKEKSIELMRNETRRLIRLVNENLDYEKIRSGQIELRRTTFDAMNVIHNVAAQLKKKAQSAGDTIEVAGPTKLPVFADYDRFVQIMFNITQNAVQFTTNGVIRISAERGYKSSILRIADNGIGMDDEQLKNIWERYYKADASRRNTKYGESGLGLAIVQQLMEQHGGKVEVISKPNKGSTFTLIFPDEKGK
ncbi:HAMP domain-containing histidine kinase [Liquorilactobacillus satsumensis]|uniref:sensor histidine kinase n=1 Tax=Liquorilactobacillus satsumensis TaxID=259059 RepID=UPI0021C36B00|nr:HAMP domain-containing sensor histidine kinase [Liquorilactobacillus satsumensis]MCP9358197.1 HAMP domain-containing histidine kinase [Liquorilactobacillus satsumensis]MCP9371731.1 HAMP domain-containing histidine kinase [Liquorilactobacillus satsumensis]